jgi:hypothetical protein
LSFRLDGLHTRRNASVLSDGSGEALPILSSGASSGGVDDDVNDDDACVLLLVPEQSYMSTRDKIDLIQPLFRHWAMDRLVELACDERIAFLKSFLTQYSRSLAIAKLVVERRQKWEMLRTQYASKFSHTKMSLPKVAIVKCVCLLVSFFVISDSFLSYFTGCIVVELCRG